MGGLPTSPLGKILKSGPLRMLFQRSGAKIRVFLTEHKHHLISAFSFSDSRFIIRARDFFLARPMEKILNKIGSSCSTG